MTFLNCIKLFNIIVIEMGEKLDIFSAFVQKRKCGCQSTEKKSKNYAYIYIYIYIYFCNGTSLSILAILMMVIVHPIGNIGYGSAMLLNCPICSIYTKDVTVRH